MKKYSLISLAFLLTLTLSANELAWVDTQIEAIKPPRKGMNSHNLTKSKDPFIFLEKNKSKSNKKAKNEKKVANTNTASLNSPKETIDSKKKVESKKLILSAIINSSALINETWYKLNDKVYAYKLSSIDRTSIVLTQGKKKLILSINEMKRNLKFNNK